MKKKPDIKKSLMFMEQMRCLRYYKRSPKKLISIRIPENLLFNFKK